MISSRIVPILIFCLFLSTIAYAETWDLYSDTWVATDALGRSVPTHETVGDPKNKTVGIFYFAWLGQHTRTGPWNIRQILEASPNDHINAPWGPVNHFHHWDEPLFGYYVSTDKYVIRKHLQMLADAGVDVLIFDNTNGFTYENVYRTMFQVMGEMHSAGLKTPSIAFFPHSTVLEKVYDDVYVEEPWEPFNHVTNFSTGNGIMQFDIDGGDPYVLIRNGFTLNANDRKTVQMRIRCPNSGNAQFFWIQNAEFRSHTFPITGSSNWQELTVDLTTNANWTGTIDFFRLDPPGSSGHIEVDYIRFVSPTEPWLKGWDFGPGVTGIDPSLLFNWKGKPLILCNDSDGYTPPAYITDFFSYRSSWAWSNPAGWFGNGYNKWPWLDDWPQKFGWHENSSVAEYVPITVGHHATSNKGRSIYNNIQPPPSQTHPEQGICLAQQWSHAKSLNPEFLFITGWNEWTAQRFLSDGSMWMAGIQRPAGDSFFVDAYTQEFSRDIEPMKGGHTDNYFYQMASIIREFKGAHPLPPASPPKSISINGTFADWEDVTPEYRDTIGDQAYRDEEHWNPNFFRYTNTTGRNDLVCQKVTQDGKNLYFYARTNLVLTSHTGTNWMLLFLDTDNNPATGWQGYDFLVNHPVVSTSQTTLEKWGTTGWEVVSSEIRWRKGTHELEIAIPRILLNYRNLESACFMNFKWADNVQNLNDVLEFTLNGDAAPNDRFMYRYEVLPLIDEPTASNTGWVLY